MKNCLIIGAAGALGNSFKKVFMKNHKIIAIDRVKRDSDFMNFGFNPESDLIS
jgi:hypothetical protein